MNTEQYLENIEAKMKYIEENSEDNHDSKRISQLEYDFRKLNLEAIELERLLNEKIKKSHNSFDKYKFATIILSIVVFILIL